jgi:hypothetical protein
MLAFVIAVVAAAIAVAAILLVGRGSAAQDSPRSFWLGGVRKREPRCVGCRGAAGWEPVGSG